MSCTGGKKRRISIKRILNKSDEPVSKGVPIKLAKEAPIPGRNERCPYHPEYKYKKCPHGCRKKLFAMRSSIAGDVMVLRTANKQLQGQTHRGDAPLDFGLLPRD